MWFFLNLFDLARTQSWNPFVNTKTPVNPLLKPLQTFVDEVSGTSSLNPNLKPNTLQPKTLHPPA